MWILVLNLCEYRVLVSNYQVQTSFSFSTHIQVWDRHLSLLPLSCGPGFFFSFKFYLFLFRGRGREGWREGQKHQCVGASCMPPTGDLAHNPDMFPDRESNQQPFGSQASAQSAEPHQPGPDFPVCPLKALLFREPDFMHGSLFQPPFLLRLDTCFVCWHCTCDPLNSGSTPLGINTYLTGFTLYCFWH